MYELSLLGFKRLGVDSFQAVMVLSKVIFQQTPEPWYILPLMKVKYTSTQSTYRYHEVLSSTRFSPLVKVKVLAQCPGF